MAGFPLRFNKLRGIRPKKNVCVSLCGSVANNFVEVPYFPFARSVPGLEEIIGKRACLVISEGGHSGNLWHAKIPLTLIQQSFMSIANP